jgi:hypothetical protein
MLSTSGMLSLSRLRSLLVALTVWSAFQFSPDSAKASGLTLTCSINENFPGAQFEGSITVAELATADRTEVTAASTLDLSTKRKSIEGPEDATVIREITESLTSFNSSAVSQYLAPGELYVHEAVTLEITTEIDEMKSGVKTVLRTIPEAPGLNSTLLHNGLPFRARCVR